MSKASSSSSTSGGIGIAGCLFLIFVTLKLTGIGSVTSPLWLPAAVIFPVVIVIGLVAGAASLFSRRRKMQEFDDE